MTTMRYAAFVLLLALQACGGGGSSLGPDPDPIPPGDPAPDPDPTPDPTPTPGRAAFLAVTAGADQRAEVGKELLQAVVVRASDTQLLAVPNQLMNFVVVSGGGSVFAGTAQTNALGEARERWTLGTTAGEQVLEARAVDQDTGDPIVFARITATADPGPAATITISETEHTMYLGERLDLATLVSAVKDQYGNDVPEPVFTASAPAPFAVEGSVVSSASEFKDQVAVFTGPVSATLTLTVLRNLTDLAGMVGSFSCSGSQVFSNATYVHRAWAFTVDSVTASESNFVVAVLWWHGTITNTEKNGVVREHDVPVESFEIGIHEPGRLWLGRLASPGTWSEVVSENPLTYEGGHYCGSNWYPLDSFEPLRLTRQ